MLFISIPSSPSCSQWLKKIQIILLICWKFLQPPRTEIHLKAILLEHQFFRMRKKTVFQCCSTYLWRLNPKTLFESVPVVTAQYKPSVLRQRNSITPRGLLRQVQIPKLNHTQIKVLLSLLCTIAISSTVLFFSLASVNYKNTFLAYFSFPGHVGRQTGRLCTASISAEDTRDCPS